MTKTEKKIQQLEHEIFLIEMKDSLDAADYSLIEEYKRQIKELERKL